MFRVRQNRKTQRTATRQLEPLERRVLLSAILVNSPLDNTVAGDGLTTLREAMDLANSSAGADHVVFDDLVFNAVASDTIVLTIGELPANIDTLNIDGTIDGSAGRVNIDAARLGRVFHNRAAALTLSNLALRNGMATPSADDLRPSGGAVLTEGGTLNLVNTDVSDSSTDGNGGAISSLDSTLNIIGGTFSRNTAVNGGALDIGPFGGSRSSTTLVGVTIENNTVSNFGGGIQHQAGLITIENSTISGNVNVRSSGGGVFASEGTVAINNCVISNNVAANAAGLNLSTDGVIRNSTISGNVAERSGGGISIFGSVTIENSTISGNSAGRPTRAGTGGGISASRGPLVITNSTLSGNKADTGGAVSLSTIQSVTIANSTISDTLAADAVRFDGWYLDSTLTLRSTIVANTNEGSGGDSDIVRVSGIVNADHSLIERLSAGTINGTKKQNRLGIDPMLGALADNGGPTMTHALLPGSPAINKGLNPLSLLYDQRGPGFARVAGKFADIGAFEVQPTAGSPAANSASPSTPSLDEQEQDDRDAELLGVLDLL